MARRKVVEQASKQAAAEAVYEVMLFHGGGTTANESVNDTCLHALLQEELKQLEAALPEEMERAEQRARWVGVPMEEVD